MWFPIFLLLPLFVGSAQAIQEEQKSEGFKIEVAVDQVFLSVNARSSDGGFVRGLKGEDFQVFEDGVHQEIVNFYSEAVPVHVVLLIDISASTLESQGEIRRAALQFAKSLSSEDKVAIITFNHDPRLILNWTNDIQKIENALLSIYAKGNTVLHDALYVTFEDLLSKVEGKKAVILLTDGVDTGSSIGAEEAMDRAIRSEAVVYVVSKLDEYWASAIAYRLELQARAQIVPKELSDPFIIQVRRTLQRLANQTGGKVLDTKNSGSLAELYRQVAEEIKNQYYISYTPHNIVRDGGWRAIELRVTQPGVVVSTRPGYFAPSKPGAGY
ncbi:MAG: VWA domain-containing protein [Acidobacteria bacterium]|nr:VWA domain-containing protein [Acidobacteriota bacterium]